MARVLVVAPEGPGTQQLLHWLRQMGHRAQRVALQGLAAVRWSEVEIVICDRDYIQAVEDRYWARWLTNCPQLWLGGSEQSAGQTPQVAGQGAVNARRVVLAAPWTFAELVTALRRLLTLPGVLARYLLRLVAATARRPGAASAVPLGWRVFATIRDGGCSVAVPVGSPPAGR
ncbi:MAG: hypothetical protein RMJ88_12620 [Thermogemmata sp.]|nr:hypothetical protein [Thermogemmata sp.]